MRPHIANVFRRVSGMPSSIIAWLYGASVPCSGDLLVALEALWERDPSAQNNVIAEGRRLLLSAFKRVEQRERWIAERECAAFLGRLQRVSTLRRARRGVETRSTPPECERFVASTPTRGAKNH